jgi:hypothetical protein
MKKYIFVALCLVFLMIPMTVTAHRNYPNESIGANKSFSDDVHLFKMGENIQVTVTSDKPIDVFIMTTADYGAGLGPKYPGNFVPKFEVLNTTSTTFNFTIPDNGSYVVVVDNAVNNINGSANPKGTVTFSYVRTDDDDHTAAIVTALSLFCLSVLAVIIIIFVVITAVAVLVRRKNKPNQAPPGTAQFPMGGPQQQVYQPPAPVQNQSQVYPGQYMQYTPPPPPPQQSPPYAPPASPQYPPVHPPPVS